MSRASFGEQPKDLLAPLTSPTHTRKKKAKKKDWL